jgi:hypothetical protein
MPYYEVLTAVINDQRVWNSSSYLFHDKMTGHIIMCHVSLVGIFISIPLSLLVIYTVQPQYDESLWSI